ncbi:MAG: mannose-1-phosphate guanylyltransferase/mannose-6-phosphate isomerase, partial [Alphaproteobacteria bacterium]
MNLAVQPVLLSGGNGSRLWPVSRTSLPKQFLALSGDGSMIQETALRVADRSRFRDPIVICGEQQRFLVADHLRMTGARPQIVLEPEGRNTAYPIAVAALLTAEVGSHDTILAVLPADHRIGDPDAFLQSIAKAAAAAAAEPVIVTLGAKPTAPETGFGYILPGAPIDGVDDAFVVERFVEKPDRPTAERYLAEGRHLWNSGMFVASAATLLAAFEEHAPEVLDAARTAVGQATRDLDFLRLPLEATRLCPEISFDYAVMERVARCAVVPSEFDWSDLGSWQAIWESGDRDANGNVVDGDVIALDSRDSYLLSDANGPLLATLGVENLVVVATRDAVLVADKARAQDGKKLVEVLNARERSEATQHPRMYRPGGDFETLG